ncbi:hypothetical protein [Aquisphaera insulae]|uniref:hypothetical protein n=1 Tax=Aquisphaera insulae TaxID=2712864 RepID=UPI0013EC5BF0|nr:hypothetical protein [Aquisphaera insulae]
MTGPLIASLIDLLRELDVQGVPLIVGGGFGLYLKRMHVDRIGLRILFPSLPPVRSTNDLDVFLRADILADLDRARGVADAIRRLGFLPVEAAKFLQWRRPVTIAGTTQDVKIDVLVGPLGPYRNLLKVSRPRVRPRGAIEFHAHTVEEALHLEDRPVEVAVEGEASDGTLYRSVVLVPEAFPYLMMKLHAFGDRKEDADKDLGRHHALDVYTIVGMMTELEYDRARALAIENRGDPHVKRAGDIVSEDFTNPAAIGILRLREHPLFQSSPLMTELSSILAEIFVP